MSKSARGYQEESYPPMPTKSTLFWRKEIFWQTYRFFILNYKIIKIVVRGHS